MRPTASRHEARLLRVIAYIHDNPGGDLSLDTLADVAAMSRFHWHRLFRALMGETCAQAVKRLRMYKAAALLVETDLPVAEIGVRVAYPAPASFSRAFSDIYRLSPGAFWAEGQRPLDTTRITIGEKIMHDVEIREVPPLHLATLEHRGPYPEIARAFQSLYAIIGANGLFPKIGQGVAVYFDDPGSTQAAELRSLAGATVPEGTDLPQSLTAHVVPGGRMAVLTYKGPYSGLPGIYDYLYGTWLATSDVEPADHPSFEVYLNDPTDTAPEDLLTEVCVPLR
ncbi:MAG: AraC family transcriptional regulator [Pseudomonadota bacterium]